VPGIADLIVGRLSTAGVRALFGVPGGGGNLDVIEAAGRANLPFVLTSTETGAAIAAIAQTEITGRPGACLTTLGPGAASVVNGVACAFLDRAPIVLFTDSNPAGAGGAFAHQQIDQPALFAAITKWSGRLESGSAGRTIDAAFCELLSVPPGPVHVEWPGDVGAVEAESRQGPDAAGQRSTARDQRERTPPDGFEALLARARKPLVLAGLGARRPDEAAAVRQLCERKQIPAMVTYKAKGVVPDTHPCFAGVFTNAAIERPLVDASDLLIGVGLDPVELLARPWTFRQPIVGIGRWLMSTAHVPFASQWVNDVAAGAGQITERLPAAEWDMTSLAQAVRAQRQLTDIPAGGLTAQRVVDVAAEALAGTSRVAVDAGAHMFPATLRWPVSGPNRMLISNGLSTMGFALPAAIGAALLDRAPVVALTGDGGLLMCAGELLTAARERLRVIVIVFSDASLSLIEIKQQARGLQPAGVALGAIRWRALAESFGMTSFGAETEADLSRAIAQAAAVDGPSLIEATVDRSNYGRMLRAIRG
jgi:acetolactate synthase-1/2/3 large subunit